MGQMTQLREGVPIFVYECEKCGRELEEMCCRRRGSFVLRDGAEDAFGVDGFVPGAAIFPLDSQSFGSFPTV